eukprot:Colp12_sorted_trinity150504_noHs@5664
MATSQRRIVRAEALESHSLVLRVFKRRWAVLYEESLAFYEPGPTSDKHGPLVVEYQMRDVAKVSGPEGKEGVLTLQLVSGMKFGVKCFTQERAESWKSLIEARAGKKEK